jgi:hypothetical protein
MVHVTNEAETVGITRDASGISTVSIGLQRDDISNMIRNYLYAAVQVYFESVRIYSQYRHLATLTGDERDKVLRSANEYIHEFAVEVGRTIEQVKVFSVNHTLHTPLGAIHITREAVDPDSDNTVVYTSTLERSSEVNSVNTVIHDYVDDILTIGELYVACVQSLCYLISAAGLNVTFDADINASILAVWEYIADIYDPNHDNSPY